MKYKKNMNENINKEKTEDFEIALSAISNVNYAPTFKSKFNSLWIPYTKEDGE